MQRPQSEDGRMATLSPARHGRHRKMAAPSLSKSCVLPHASSSARSSAQVAASSANVMSDGYTPSPRRPKTTPKPRIERLLVGPGKAHLQHAQSPLVGTTSSSTEFFMTHLPDSPPRKFPTHSPPRSVSPPLSSSSDDDSDAEENDDTAAPVDEHEQLLRSSLDVGNEQSTVALTDARADAASGSAFEAATDATPPAAADFMTSTVMVQRESTHTADDEDALNESQDTSSHSIVALESSQAVDRSSGGDDSDAKDTATECEDEPATHGPLQIDLLLVRPPSPVVREHQPQVDTNDSDDDSDTLQAPESSSETDNDTDVRRLRGAHAGSVAGDQLPPPQDYTAPGDSDDDEYTRSLAARQRLLDEERQREQMRSDLESYVTSLTTRRSDDGTQLVEFPKNYQHVLSLMSERDVRDEDTTGASGQSSNTTRAATSGSSSQRSWSHVLLQAGLSKQQAFGSLDAEDDPSGGESGSMAAKIALKIARVRQLDAVLEEKLGKNLYATPAGTASGSKAPLSKKSKPERGSGGASASGEHQRTFVTQPNSSAKESVISAFGSSRSSSNNNSQQQSPRDICSRQSDDVLQGPLLSSTTGAGVRGTSNFVERNRKVIAHGMKAVLSPDEETRLQRLLRELDSDDTAAATPPPAASPLEQQSALEPLDRNEFALDADTKREIDELLAAKRGAYQTSLLPPSEDDGVNDDLPTASVASTAQAAVRSKRESAVNIVQATKRERLRKQRLERIDMEIRFLHANERLAIVPDDSGDCDDASSIVDDAMSDDGTRSERSCATSVCSTRSGVISRRAFTQFLASATSDFAPTAKASPDAIRQLVASLAHLTTRPVA